MRFTLSVPGVHAFATPGDVAVTAQAIDAARLIRVEYEPLPHFANEEQAMRPDAPKLFDAGNVVQAPTPFPGNRIPGVQTGGRNAAVEIDIFIADHAFQYGGPEPLPSIPLWAPAETLERLEAFAPDLDSSFVLTTVSAGDTIDVPLANLVPVLVSKGSINRSKLPQDLAGLPLPERLFE